MKCKRILAPVFSLGLVLALWSAAAAQSAPPVVSNVAMVQSDTQKSFDQLKTLAGSWEGSYGGTPMHITLRVTSMGHTLMHEMSGGDRPDDPISMFTIDGDHLLLTHYCDAGNQPHMIGTVSPDGKTITFNFIDATNLKSSQEGHMQRAVFKFVDQDHHSETWEFAMADGKPMGATLDLKRSK